MIILNFKTYPQATTGGFKLVKIAEKVSKEYEVPIILCVQATDIFKFSQITDLPIYAQHMDPIEPGRNTGFISPLAIIENGASGVLLNHSEHRLAQKVLSKSIAIAKKYKLSTLVCAETPEEAAQIDTFEPDFIALEDPILIGGDVSIVNNLKGRNQVKKFIAQKLKATPLIGAGIKTKIDISTSLKLKAKGVLLASGFVKAEDPLQELSQLAQGFKK